MLLRNVTVVPVTSDSEQALGKARSGHDRRDQELRPLAVQRSRHPSSEPFLIVYFNRFEFRSRNDQKPDVTVDIRDVVFAGPLSSSTTCAS